MPIYEYKGQQYDIATDDPALAKSKILKHLGTQEEAPAPTPAPKPESTASSFDFGNPMGTGSEEIMAAAKTPTAPKVEPKPQAPKPPPYKNRVEMLDDAVNLLEEGVDREEMKQSLQKMGVKWDDVVKHGQQRGSDYFKQQAGATAPVPGPIKPTSSGEIKATPETEFFSTPYDWTKEALGNTFKRVDASLGDAATSYLYQTGVTDADGAGQILARNAKQRAAAAPSQAIREGMEEIGNAKTYGQAISALATNPRATFTMLVESVLVSAPGMVPSLVLGPAGVVARAGAAGVSSGGLEYGSVMADVLQDKGVNMLDANAVSKALSDPKIMAEIKDKGAKRGLIVGAFDALSMGMAGRFLKPAQALIAEGKLAGSAAKKATMAAWGKELTTQMAGGAGGEFAAQKATGENKPADVLMEALAEGFTAPLEARSNLREAQLAEQQAAVNADLAEQKQEPSTAAQAAQARADKITALTQVLVQQGIPAENAGPIATRKVDADLKAEAKTAAIKAPESRVEQLTQELIASGTEPQQAKIEAQRLAQEEAEADANAEKETQGAANAGQPITQPSGTSVSVAGQPSAEPATGGVGVPEPSGMVSTGQNATNAPAGETVEPTAVEETPAVEEAPAPPAPPKAEVTPEAVYAERTKDDPTAPPFNDTDARIKRVADLYEQMGDKDFAKVVRDIPNQGRPSYEETAQLEAALEVDQKEQAFQAKKAKVESIARVNASSAFDQVGNYPSLQEAIDSLANNMGDTLVEEGYKKGDDWNALLTAANRAFEDEVNRLKGEQVGTETPEAVQTTQEGQAAPTAPAVTKGKRGRPPVKQTHVVAENSEGKFDHVTNGEVAGTYANKKQATAAVNLAKAKDKGDAALIAKNQEKLDQALASQGRGRPANTTVNENGVVIDHDAKVEINALESALETYNSPAAPESVLNAAMYIHDVANDTTAPKAARERAQQMLDEDIDPKDVARSKTLRSTEGNVGKGDTGFNKAANGVQAITHIMNTGTAFQKFIAGRIRNFLAGVKFVVVEKGDPMPPELRGARGLFDYNPVTKERTVYVRGASFGDQQGINNITVLHELLHAATANRITAGLMKGLKNAQLQRFMRDMEKLMQRAQEAYEEGIVFGEMSPEIQDMIERTANIDHKTGRTTFDIFASPHEFLAYGMSSPVFQKFLMGIQGVRTETTGFSAFTNGIRNLFGLQKGDATAFSDLVDITDKMLDTRVTPFEMGATALQQKGKKTPPKETKLTPPVFDEKADIRARRSALELEREARKAKKKVADSREGDLAITVAALQGERDPSKVRKILTNAWSWMDYAQREALVRLPTFDFLAKWAAEKGINALTETNRHLEHMLGMSQQFLAGAEQVIGMLDRGFKEDKNLDRKNFEDFVYATTVAEIDPSDPNAVERSATLDKDYKALGTVGQRMFKALKDYYEAIIELYSDLLDAQIENAQGISAEDKKNLMALLRKTFETTARIRPYFPLVRRGDFWLAIGKPGEDRRFYTFESRLARNEKAKELAAGRGDDIEDMLFRQEFEQGNDLRSLRTASKDSSQMLTKTFDAIDKMEMGEDSADAKEGLKDAVYQIYLSTMPEQTFRKQFTHRKNRTGFSTDVRQNVATTAAKQATQLARLKYAPLLRNSLSAAKDSIREQEELSPFIQEAEKRVNMALSGGKDSLSGAIAGAANKASFFWYLSGASSALIQPSSIFISGLPVLAGNYNNVSGAALEIGKMAVLVNQYSMLRTNSDGTVSISAPSIANNKSLPEDERRAVSEMVSRGVSQSTYASMVWGYKQTPTESMYFRLDKGFGNIPVAYGKGKRLASFLVGALMHNTERLSREAVYLAAYRLGKKAGMSYDEAVQRAVESTNEALGNYDITNKPRFMQEGIGKVAFQFKMYPLQMTLLMVTSLKKMLPFLNKEGKKEAATKFFGMMGTSALIGGVSNMALFSPIMGLIGWAWGKMGDDEDWPDDLKKLDFITWFRTVFVPEHLGDVEIGGVPVSELIDRGPINAITGYDIASRIGLNDLWGRDSKETKTARDSAVAYMLDNFAGPTASLALGFADAYDAYAMGDYQKMQEKLAPAAVRNLLVANRMANEGMMTGRGAELVNKDDVKTGELIGQAIGFRPDILAATQGPAFKLTGIEQRILNQRNLLLNKLDFQLRQNTDKGDEKFEKILDEEVSKFNTKHPSYALDSDTIYDSLVKKTEQRAGSRAGVIATEKNVPIIEEATDTLEKRLDRRAAEMKALREKTPR